MTNTNSSFENKTIVYFHTGRGGRFYNGGHTTFNGKKNIMDVLRLNDNGKNWNFYHDRDEKGRYCEPYYADCNGNYLISLKEAKTGVGSLDWDGEYDTDTCIFLCDCSANDLKTIFISEDLDKIDVIQEYFNECTDLNIDWSRFDGDYNNLIDFYFDHTKFDVEDFYEQIEEE